MNGVVNRFPPSFIVWKCFHSTYHLIESVIPALIRYTHTQHTILTHLNTGRSTSFWMKRKKKKNPLHNSLLSFIRLLRCSVIAYLIQLNSMNNYLFKFGVWWHIHCMNHENIRRTRFGFYEIFCYWSVCKWCLMFNTKF